MRVLETETDVFVRDVCENTVDNFAPFRWASFEAPAGWSRRIGADLET